MMMLSFLLLLLVFVIKSSGASYNGLSDELRFIHREMGSLRDENQKQNMELASLKETVQLQNKTISRHETTIKQLIADNRRIIKSDHPVSSAAKTRRKRPAQLIPTSSLYDKRKKNDYNQNRKLFYGPPTNCSDLNRLGYTLNGFYMVQKPTNDEKLTHLTVLDAVYCNFKQEKTFNPSLVEQPVLPSPFTAPLLSNHAFFSPILPPDDGDVYFWFIAVRNKKDYSGVLTFDPSQYNKGNGFDGKTGYFKAPKFGIYHFLYETVFGGRGNGTSVDFYMNEVLIVNPLSIISRDSMSLQVTLKLKAGDSVCLKATIRSNSNQHFSTVSYDVLSETVKGFLLKSTTFF